MKKLTLILALFLSIGAFAANPKTVQSINHTNTITHNPVSISKENKVFFQLGLIYSTVSCGSGFTGSKTYWIVYDTTTGAVVGGGVYNQCIPVVLA